jgi:hypothetical protein
MLGIDLPLRPGSRPKGASSDLADASQEILVDLEIDLGLDFVRLVDLRSTDRNGNRHGQIRVGQSGGRDLDEPDVLVREEEDRCGIIGEDAP